MAKITLGQYMAGQAKAQEARRLDRRSQLIMGGGFAGLLLSFAVFFLWIGSANQLSDNGKSWNFVQRKALAEIDGPDSAIPAGDRQ